MQPYSLSNPPKNNMHRLLAANIGFVCSEARAHRFVDFGCWKGTLNYNLKYYWDCPSILIDAIERNCNDAKILDPSAVVRWLTINPTGVEIKVLNQAAAAANSSLLTLATSIYAKSTTNTMTVPAGPNISPAEYAAQYRDELQDSFLKINIEGVDLYLLDAVLNADIVPAAVMFEVPDDFSLLSSIIKRLKALNFYIPPDLTISPGRDSSFCFSRDVGFSKKIISASSSNHLSSYTTFRRI